MIIHRLLRVDGKVEDLGDFSDFYLLPDRNLGEDERRHLQQMQDEVGRGNYDESAGFLLCFWFHLCFRFGLRASTTSLLCLS